MDAFPSEHVNHGGAARFTGLARLRHGLGQPSDALDAVHGDGDLPAQRCHRLRQRGHAGESGSLAYFSAVGDCLTWRANLNGAGNTFELEGVDTTSYTAITSGIPTTYNTFFIFKKSLFCCR